MWLKQYRAALCHPPWMGTWLPTGHVVVPKPGRGSPSCGGEVTERGVSREHGILRSSLKAWLPGCLPLAGAPSGGPVLFGAGNWKQKHPELKRNVLLVDLKTQNTGWFARKVVLKWAVSICIRRPCCWRARVGTVLSLKSSTGTQHPEVKVHPEGSCVSQPPHHTAVPASRDGAAAAFSPAPSPEGKGGGGDMDRPAR